MDLADRVFDPALLRAWRRLWLNRAEPYAVQGPDGGYAWVHRRCRWYHLEAHLLGQLTLAVSSADAAGWCRWACLDADAPDSLPVLHTIANGLADLGFVGQLEASRRGGHLWYFLEQPAPVSLVRRALIGALGRLAAAGVPMTPLELYPDQVTGDALGHGVRLPLGVHRKSSLRYPLLDPKGYPLVFADLAAAVAYLLDRPRIPVAWLRADWSLPSGSAPIVTNAARPVVVHPVPTPGTRSAVIRWVDAEVSPLDLLAEFVPDATPRRSGKGYLAWCPFHDDRAPDEQGAPGTPSLYLVNDARYGWSWRCFSPNCRHSVGPMRHSFRLFMALTGQEAADAITHAATRWPESDTTR